MNIELLKQMIKQGYVTCKKHDTQNLYIFNYTQKTQYEGVWNEVTLQCRGLILDKDYNYIARPFKKFFNLEETNPNDLPNEPFEVFEKLDGSLGILYFIGDKPYIATRNAFNSEQAIWATSLLHTRYNNIIQSLDINITYLFEIIYKQNKIVVDYDFNDIVLIGMIETQTGKELDIKDFAHTYIFKHVKRHEGTNNVYKLKSLEEKNKEGFVVRYANGFRVKVKFSEYLKLHKIITGVSNIAVWEHLSSGKDFSDLLEVIPNEFYEWLTQTKNDLETQYNEILCECINSYKELETRKETAQYFQKQVYPAILFSLLDRRKEVTNELIWKLLKPKHEKGFRTLND